MSSFGWRDIYIYLWHIYMIYVYHTCDVWCFCFKKIAKWSPKFFSRMFTNHHTFKIFFPQDIQIDVLTSLIKAHQTGKDSVKEGMRLLGGNSHIPTNLKQPCQKGGWEQCDCSCSRQNSLIKATCQNYFATF